MGFTSPVREGRDGASLSAQAGGDGTGRHGMDGQPLKCYCNRSLPRIDGHASIGRFLDDATSEACQSQFIQRYFHDHRRRFGVKSESRHFNSAMRVISAPRSRGNSGGCDGPRHRQRMLTRLAASTGSLIDDPFVSRAKNPTRWLMIAFALAFVRPALLLTPVLDTTWRQVAALLIPALFGWLVIALTAAAQDAAFARADISVADNLRARRRRTRSAILGRMPRLSSAPLWRQQDWRASRWEPLHSPF